MDRRQHFQELVFDADLTNREIAEICYVSPHTAKSWMLPTTSKAARTPPLMALALLCIELDIPMVKQRQREAA